jgi:hypothetical protein
MKLYKYCDESSVDILKNNRLKITQIDSFNDPFEFKLSADTNITFDTVLEDITTDEIAAKKVLDFFTVNNIYQDTNLPKFLNWFKQHGQVYINDLKAVFETAIKDAIEKTFSEHMNKEYRVMCFSVRSDSILMWSHYGKQHQGMLFKFESDYLSKDKIESTDELILKVEYQNDRVQLPPTISVRNEKVRRAMIALTKTKYKDWEYEQECRILVKFDREENYPYIDINPRAIEEIVLGLYCDWKTEILVKDLLRKSEYSHVSLKKAKIDFNKFALIYEQI